MRLLSVSSRSFLFFLLFFPFSRTKDYTFRSRGAMYFLLLLVAPSWAATAAAMGREEPRACAAQSSCAGCRAAGCGWCANTCVSDQYQTVRVLVGDVRVNTNLPIVSHHIQSCKGAALVGFSRPSWICESDMPSNPESLSREEAALQECK